MARRKAPPGAAHGWRKGNWVVLIRKGAGERPREIHLGADATEQDAIELAAELNAEIQSGRIEAPHKWEALIESFLADRRARGLAASTVDQYGYRLRAVAKVLAHRPPLRLTREDGDEFARVRIAEGISAATVAGELDAMTIAQRWAVDKEWIQRATWSTVPRPRLRERYKRNLSPVEIGALFRAADRLAAEPPGNSPREAWQQWPALLGVVLQAPRVSEVISRRVADLSFAEVHSPGGVYVEARIRIPSSKTRASERYLPIADSWTVEHLQRIATDADGTPRRLSAPLFVSTRGGAYTSGAPLIVKLRETCKAADVAPERVTLHSLRHSVATLLAEIGAPTFNIAKLLGHASDQITQRTYIATTLAQSRPASEILGRGLGELREGRTTLRVIPGGG